MGDAIRLVCVCNWQSGWSASAVKERLRFWSERALSEHRERIEAALTDAKGRASAGAAEIPRRVWMFWDQGWRLAPELIELCLADNHS